MNTGRIITTALAASILAIPAMAADAPGYFKVPGTETSLQVYGYAGLDATYDMVGGSSAATATFKYEKPTNQWTMAGRGRLGVTTTTPSAYGDVVTKIEWNAMNGSIRHCYMTMAGLTVGQAETTWSIPGADNLGTVYGSDSIGTERLPLIRYSFPISKQATLNMSFEQPQASNDLGDAANNKVPGAIVVGFDFADSWGAVGGRVLAQKYNHWDDTDAGVNYNKTATSFRAYGSVNIGQDTALVSATFGKGLGDYLNDGNDGVVNNHDNTASIELYKTVGLFAQYTHVWTPAITSNIGVSQLKYKKVMYNGVYEYGDPAGTNVKSLNQVFVNTSVALTKTVKFTGEYCFGDRKTFHSQDNTFQAGTQTVTSRKESQIFLRLDAQLW